MKFEKILPLLGDFGTYQRLVYFMACLIWFPTAWMTLIQVFATGDSDHWCKVPWWNDTICEHHGFAKQFCNGELKKLINIPLTDPDNGTGNYDMEFEKCSRYNLSSVAWNLLPEVFVNGSHGPTYSYYEYHQETSHGIIGCDAGWEYDRSQYTATLVQELNLVCGEDAYIQYAQALYYVGYFSGSLLFGALADAFGRYPMLFIATVLRIVSAFALAFVRQFWAFAAVRFFQGLSTIGSTILGFVLAMEFVGPSKRNVSGFIIEIVYAFGYMVLGGLAYAIRDWRKLQLTIAGLSCGLLFVFIFLPESVRWLLSKGKTEKARRIVLKAAKINKVSIPEHLLFDDLTEKKEGEFTRKPNVTDLFRHPQIRKRTIILAYHWMAIAIVYHGLNLSTSYLGINVYLSFFVSAAVEIPAFILGMFIIEWFGRKKSQSGTLLLAGVACLSTTFIPLGGFRAAVAMVGKFGVTAAYGILFLYIVELFPTEIRSIGMGFCSMMGRLINILAPLILLTGKYWKPLPLVIFGCATSLAGLLTWFLPETKGRKLPDKIQEGENYMSLPKQKTTGADQAELSGSKPQDVYMDNEKDGNMNDNNV